VPLGGFVQMAGQHDFDQAEITGAPDEYTSKSVPARMFIIVSGVLMNALLGFALLVVAFRMGVSYTPAVVGECKPGDEAYEANLREGDRVLLVNDTPVRNHFELRVWVALAGTAEPILLRVRGERDGEMKEMTLPITPKHTGEGFGTIDIPQPRRATSFFIGCRSPKLKKAKVIIKKVFKDSAAAAAGFKENDVVLSAELDGEVVEDGTTDELTGLVKKSRGRPIRFLVRRRGEPEPIALMVEPRLIKDEKTEKENYLLGVVFNQYLRLGGIEPDSPVERAGLREGDRVAIAGIAADDSWGEFKWERRGEKGAKSSGTARVRPEPGGGWGELVLELTRRKISRHLLFSASEDALGQRVTAFGRAASETTSMLRLVWYSLYALVTVRVSPKTMGGPVTIVRATASSVELGLGFYLWFVALISINLAVLNILPIPVLDGGHVAFLAYEGVRGRPAHRRVQEIAQTIGLVLILGLVIYVTKNDIVRWLGL